MNSHGHAPHLRDKNLRYRNNKKIAKSHLQLILRLDYGKISIFLENTD